MWGNCEWRGERSSMRGDEGIITKKNENWFAKVSSLVNSHRHIVLICKIIFSKNYNYWEMVKKFKKNIELITFSFIKHMKTFRGNWSRIISSVTPPCHPPPVFPSHFKHENSFNYFSHPLIPSCARTLPIHTPPSFSFQVSKNSAPLAFLKFSSSFSVSLALALQNEPWQQLF